MAQMMVEDRRFNRRQIPRQESIFTYGAVDNSYYAERGFHPLGNSKYSGLIKCKLAHGRGYSVVIPDFIFIGGGAKQWIQPLSFLAPLLAKTDGGLECSVYVDISCGQTIQIHFRNSDFVGKFSDCSEAYRCTISGPDDLGTYATGTSEIRSGNVPFITLYHHTRSLSKASIESGREFWPSQWNIQGTKRLANVGYVYFTPLDMITSEEDLYQIAMASKGTIYSVVDHFLQPRTLSPEWEEEFTGFVLPLHVYRESTKNRTATLAFMVDSTSLASQHLLRHESSNGAVFYEVCKPFIHRVGLPVHHNLRFTDSSISPPLIERKLFEYAVVGDALTVSGLAAPYDEENTQHILKIECVPARSTLLDFWVGQANRDHFTDKVIELPEFQ
jgi:hypothetical protein